MQLGPTCFLVPSKTFHEQALKLDVGPKWEYHLTAALSPEAFDEWTLYRVARSAVGTRLMAIIDDLEGQRVDLPSLAMSTTQKGILCVSEFTKLLMLGSMGELEASLPVTNDDQRDVEVHQHGRFDLSASFQIHGTMKLGRHRQADLLDVRFDLPADRVRSDPRFWYFFTYLDGQQMGFGSPCFVVPSKEVHLHAYPYRKRNSVYFNFSASMALNSGDRWTPYRVEPLKVGQRVLEIVRNSARPDAPWRQLKAS
jgi:hypothetical protein